MMLQHVTEDLDDKGGDYIRSRTDVQPKTFAGPPEDQGETDQGAFVR